MLPGSLPDACGRSFWKQGVSIVNVGHTGLYHYAPILQREGGGPHDWLVVQHQKVSPAAATAKAIDYSLGRWHAIAPPIWISAFLVRVSVASPRVSRVSRARGTATARIVHELEDEREFLVHHVQDVAVVARQHLANHFVSFLSGSPKLDCRP